MVLKGLTKIVFDFEQTPIKQQKKGLECSSYWG